MDERGEVELEGVVVARGVRALHLAQLALEAVVHHRLDLAGREGADVVAATASITVYR